MPTKIELLQEAERRGILPANKRELYDEAVKRGLIKSVKAEVKQPHEQQSVVTSPKTDETEPEVKNSEPDSIYGEEMSADPDFAKLSARDQNVVMMRLSEAKPTKKSTLGAGTQPYLKSLKESRTKTDIKSPSLPESEVYSGKKLISDIARPVISGLTSAGGAIAGTAGATPGFGTVVGGGLGYAIGEEIADHLDEFLGLRERQPLMVELKESAMDVAEGSTYEAGGQVVAAAAAPVIRFVANKIPKLPFTKAGAEKAAGKQLIAQTDKGPIVAKNYDDARDLEELVPGLKFRVGQLTNDPGVVKFERARARMPGESAAGQAELQEQNTQAIINYIENVKGKADIGDVKGTLRAEREGIETGVTEAQKALERETAGVGGGMGAVETGEQIRGAARTGERLAKKEGGKLFEDVPQFEIDGKRVLDKIDEISQPTTRMERIEKTIPEDFEWFKEKITESGRKVTPQDLQDMSSDIGESVAAIKNSPNSTKFDRAKARRLSMLKQEVDDVLKEAGEFEDLTTPTGQAKHKGKIIQTGRLKKELSDIDKKIQTEQQFVDKQIDLDKTFQELQSKRVPGVMRQVNEGTEQYTERLARDYKATFGKDAPAKPTKERASITKAKKRKAEIETIIKESVPIEAEEMATASGKLKDARGYWRKEVIEKYKQGTIGEILKTTSKGDKVGNAQVASRFFKPGQKGVQQADEFISAIGDNPQAKTAMEDYIKQDLLEYATNPVTGEVTETKLKTWLSKYKPTLKKYGMEKRFDSIIKARSELDDALVLKKEFDKSQASKLLNSDVDKAMQNALSTGSKRTEVKKLMKAVKGDKKAISGIQNSLIDHIVYKDVDNKTPRTIAKLNDQYLKYKPALLEAFKDSPEKIRAIRVYRDVMKKLDIGKASPIGGGSDTAENIVSGIAQKFGLSNNMMMNAARSAVNILKGNSDKTIDMLLNRASYDPEFAYTLMLIAKGRKPNIIKRRLYGHIMSTGSTGIRQELKKD